MSFTLTEGTFLSTSVNSPIAGFLTGCIMGPGMWFLFHIGSGPDGVFGEQLLELLEKHISELVWFLCIESVQQFLPLAFPELVTEVV